MPTLYELTKEFQYLADLLSDGEIDEQTVKDTLEGMDWEDMLEEKADGYAKIIRQFQANAAAAKEEADRLTKRRRMFEGRAEQLLQKLLAGMKAVDRSKIQTAFATYSIRATPERVVINDIQKLGDYIEYWKPRKWDESEVDKKAVKEALMTGKEVPGAHLERGESLQIR